MKHVTILFCSLLLLGSFSCKKQDTNTITPVYTIQGRVYESYPKVPYAKQSITLRVTRGANDTYVEADLGTATTDDSGYFKITYDQTSISGGDPGGGPAAEIHMFSQFFTFDGIPVNQNVNKAFYNPTKGKLKINLQTSNPLEKNHDTLFIAYLQYTDSTKTSQMVVDTITQTINGYFKTIITPPLRLNIAWGRNSKVFQYDPKTKQITNANVYYATISGDPIIDNATINY